MPRVKFRDTQGNEFDIPEDRIISVTGPDGEEIEEQAWREPEVEGQKRHVFGLSDDPNVAYTIRFTDDSGQEQEVEGQAWRGG